MHAGNESFLHAAITWQEQRVFNELAIQALEHDKHPLVRPWLALDGACLKHSLCRRSASTNASLSSTTSPWNGLKLYAAGASVSLSTAKVTLTSADKC